MMLYALKINFLLKYSILIFYFYFHLHFDGNIFKFDTL